MYEPWLTTWSTTPSVVNRSMSAGPSAVSASRSRSPIVSLRRRYEPAGSSSMRPGVSLSASMMPSIAVARLVEQHPLRTRLETGDALEDQRLGLGREALEVAQRARLGGLAQVVHGLDAQLAVELADRLGTEARDPQELDQAGRHLGGELVVVGHPTRASQLVDLVADGLADAGDGRRVAGPVRRHEVDRTAPDGVRRAVIGDGLEDQLALDLEHVADVVEDPGEVAVGQVRLGRRGVVVSRGGVGAMAHGVLGLAWVTRGRTGRRIGPGDAAGHGRDGTRAGDGAGSRPYAATTRSRPARLAR